MSYDFRIPAQQGWECPKCGRVYAPWNPMCDFCGKGEDIITTTFVAPVGKDYADTYSSIGETESKEMNGNNGKIHRSTKEEEKPVHCKVLFVRVPVRS